MSMYRCRGIFLIGREAKHGKFSPFFFAYFSQCLTDTWPICNCIDFMEFEVVCTRLHLFLYNELNFEIFQNVAILQGKLTWRGHNSLA